MIWTIYRDYEFWAECDTHHSFLLLWHEVTHRTDAELFTYSRSVKRDTAFIGQH